MSKNTLVTGGAGFLGTRLVKALLDQAEEVSTFDLSPSVTSGASAYCGDLGSSYDVMNVVAATRPARIFHCGGVLSSRAEENMALGIRTNAEGTLHVLEAARILGVRQVLFASTISTYGEDVSVPVPEGAPQRPTTIYGITKVYAERMGEYYARRYGLDFRGVRFPSVIGPGRRPTGGSAYTSLMIDEPARGRPYVVPVSPITTLPILYVDDAVRALLDVAEAPNHRLQRRVYNVAGLSPRANEIAAEVRRAVPTASISFETDTVTQRLVDSWPSQIEDAQARSEWGWEPPEQLTDLVDRFVAAVSQQSSLGRGTQGQPPPGEIPVPPEAG